MGISTTQQLNRFYDLYQKAEVVFTKELTATIRLVPKQIYIRCKGSDWPCIINSTSFLGAKVIIGAKSSIFGQLQKAGNSVSLRFCFQRPDSSDLTTFYVSGKVTGMGPFANSPDLMLLSITYSQRPPDDMIDILGNLLDANVNSARRREERIILTPDNMRRLGLMKKETLIFIQGVPRKCILRDISFSGAKVIMVGVAAFLKNKEVTVRVDFDDPREILGLKGTIVRTEDVEGRKDLVAVAIMYADNGVPMPYKMHINKYLTQYSKKQLEIDSEKNKEETKENTQEKGKENLQPVAAAKQNPSYDS